MKTFTLSLLLAILYGAAGAQCAAPVITASGPATFCPGGSVTLSAPAGDKWTRKADFGGTARVEGAGFSIGSKGYMGTGYDGSLKKDFWEYDPAANVWTQKADFGGTARVNAVGISIGSKGYIGTGADGGVLYKDFWEYDPATNVWTRKADFGGTARNVVAGFSIGSKGYIGTGADGSVLYKDFWEYDPATNVWTRKADFGGAARDFAAGFSIGTKGYIGTGYNANVYYKDFWEYDPAANAWIRKADFGGADRVDPIGFSIGNKGYIGTGWNNLTNVYYKDFWEYDPAANLWTRKADFGGAARFSAIGFSIGSKAYIGIGADGSVRDKDFWEYDPGFTYSWSPGGQTTSSVTVNATANYTVTTTNALGCSATSAITTVTVATPVTPTITTSGSTTFCSGSSVTLTSSSATAYQWYLNNTLIPGATSQSYTASGGGNYTVTTVNASGCSATSVVTVVTVNTITTPVINAPGGTVICPGGGGITLSTPGGNVWTQRADLGGGARYAAAGFSIGSKGYVGTGSSFIYKKDFWEYDPSTNVWTQKADFGGAARHGATGFSIGDKGYIGLGYNDGYLNDFWEYNPSTNTWVQKANFGGASRRLASGFSIGGKGYIGTGFDGAYKKDFWEYDPSANTWSQKADFGGGVRYYAVGFSSGTKGYMGTGTASANTDLKKDFWEYDPSTNAWTQKADFGGTAREGAAGFSAGSRGYIGTGYDGAYKKDFWEYNPATDLWTQKPDFGGTAKAFAFAFSTGNKGYIGAGSSEGFLADFWEYAPGNSFVWSPGGQTTSSITVTTAGNYTVTTTSLAGCSAASAITKVTAYSSTVLYVDSSKAASGDGSSWANAYKELREALFAAGQCGSIATINVAKGTYKPTDDANRDSSFTIYRGGLKLYGGYPSGGGTRDIAANTTILSGDIGSTNNTADNSHHVIIIAGLADNADSLVLDGFTVSGGNANRTGTKTYNGASLYQGDGAGINLSNDGAGGKTVIRNCVVTNNAANNNGGGFYNQSSSPVVINCVFATNSGSCMYNGFSSPSVTNCVFVSNNAFGNGAAMVNVNSSPVVTNCTFTRNTTTGNGIIFNQNPSTPRFVNTIIWDNTSADNSALYNTISTPSVNYSDIQGGYGGTGNVSSDPLFVNSTDADGGDNIFGTADDGLKLRLGSPAGSTGSNAALPSGITTDITGTARIQDGTVDMGAYESQSCPSSPVLYVDGSKATSGDGSSWANAYNELKDALYVANSCGGVTTINVARGTYKPVAFANPDSAFTVCRGGLKIYGGYPSGGGVRNTFANPTILSGDIGAPDVIFDNSYHILVIAGLSNTADSVVIDGFTLTAGNAAGTGSVVYNGVALTRDHGAAIDAEQNSSGKLAFRNLIIANNAGGSNWGGALVLSSSNATLEKCIFYGNSTSGTGQGGAVWNNSSTTTMTNCLLYNNYGAGLGGAIQLNGSNPLTIINSTFYANRTGGNGAAIRSGAGSVLNLSNTIFYKNDIGAQNGSYAAPGNDLTLVGTYTITNCMMQGSAASYSGAVNSVFGGDPLFVNEAAPAGADNVFGTSDDGLHLQAGSPAINAGSNTAVPSGIATDITGSSRIQNSTVDMGAYENVLITVFTFTGSGAWSTAANWLNNLKPPSPLPAGYEVIIDPAGGNCTLDVAFTLSQGSKLTVKTGKKLSVQGNVQGP